MAIAEQTRVANSPAVEVPPNSFEDADLQRMRQSRLTSPAKARRMIFWRSKSKSTNEKTHDKRTDDRNNNASKSVDQASPEIIERTITTARIITKAPPPSPPQETDSNGNNVQKTPKTERGKFLFLCLLLLSQYNPVF